MNREWVQDGRMFDWLNRLAGYITKAPNMDKQTIGAMIERFAMSEAIKGDTTAVDVGLVLDVMHSTLVHNAKFRGEPKDVGLLNCRVAVDIPAMIKHNWKSKGKSDAGFNVADAFAFYLERMKMDPEKMHPVQLKETRRAFYGGVSTYLRMLTDSSINSMEDAMAQLNDVEKQCTQFWINETKGTNG